MYSKSVLPPCSDIIKGRVKLIFFLFLKPVSDHGLQWLIELVRTCFLKTKLWHFILEHCVKYVCLFMGICKNLYVVFCSFDFVMYSALFNISETKNISHIGLYSPRAWTSLYEILPCIKCNSIASYLHAGIYVKYLSRKTLLYSTILDVNLF